MTPDSIRSLINRRRVDLQETAGYPIERLAEIIREVGFSCDCCTRCCTADFNGHVFLLDKDAAKIRTLEPAGLVPAPGYEFCDQHGMFYVSGYSLRTRPDGTCIFLLNDRCRIYADRPEICRVYPYMLHREPDDAGVLDWRQISGLDEHGTYHDKISDDESLTIARMTKEYELSFLSQEIAFLEFILEYFERQGLRHVKRVYDLRMRDFHKGHSIDVYVWNGHGLELNAVGKKVSGTGAG
ncbi:MAG: YkgJ family cysteine cluster protein [Methanoregulaceae archaeon]|nr:YkgJ family cysteine cluster protein [Methanoregulaceae archaeon]